MNKIRFFKGGNPWGVTKGIFITLLILVFSFSLAYAAYTISIEREFQMKKTEFLTSGITVQFENRSVIISPITNETFADQVQVGLMVPALEKKSAVLRRIKGQYKIDPEVVGFSLDRDALLGDLQGRVRTFSKVPIMAKLMNESPEILQSDFRAQLPQILKKLDTPIVASSKDFSFTLRLRDHMDLVEFHKNTAIEVSLAKDPFTQFITNDWLKKINRPMVAVSISKGKGSKLQFEGKGKNGLALNIEELRHIINTALTGDVVKIELPIEEQPFTVTASPEVQAMGVKEVLSIGHTTYYGSPTNRMFNISVGMKKFDGVVVPPGEVFSFNKNLGPVDGGNGFLKELVIKPEGTIPEFGGGLCQVSTTAYRAALYAGLPIVERTPHSYAVSYYSQVGGHGIDATIYPGVRDLKFKNDTSGSIAMQSYAEGSEAYFILYGSNDGRTVKMEGPDITNRHSDGTTENTKTTTLPVGKIQRIETAHQGFNTLWYRYITLPGGLASKEEIASQYRATRNRFLVGATAEEIAGGAKGPSAPSFKD